MQLNNLLIAGPWVGEFGWELFCWQAYVRSLSKNFHKTICISTPHSKFIYEDFCDEFIEFTAESSGYKDSYYRTDFKINSDVLKQILEKSQFYSDFGKKETTIFLPKRIGDPPRTHYTESFSFGKYNIVPEYVRYGKPVDLPKKTVVVHARNRKLRSKDNWSQEKWIKLVDFLSNDGYNIVSIGLKSESLHIEGSVDMRECEQHKLLDLLASSACIFGPSSGAMHLASLCGCPQVVWTTDYNLDRYTKNWNPFSTPVLFLSEHGWNPDPEYVYKNFQRFVNETNQKR